MKAVVVHQYGGPEVLKFEEYPDPVAGPGEDPGRVVGGIYRIKSGRVELVT